MSTTAVDVAVRRAARIQEVVMQRGWSMTTAASLADELGVSVRTVARQWVKVQRWTRASLNPAEVDRMRVHQLMRLEHHIAGAAAKGDYSAAMKGELVYAQLTGTIAPTRVEVRGQVAVEHSAAIAAVSRMTVEELRAIVDAGDAESPAGSRPAEPNPKSFSRPRTPPTTPDRQ